LAEHGPIEGKGKIKILGLALFPNPIGRRVFPETGRVVMVQDNGEFGVIPAVVREEDIEVVRNHLNGQAPVVTGGAQGKGDGIGLADEPVVFRGLFLPGVYGDKPLTAIKLEGRTLPIRVGKPAIDLHVADLDGFPGLQVVVDSQAVAQALHAVFQVYRNLVHP
jgi:hypothetical protein